MKKYANYTKDEHRKAMKQKLNELILFQALLLENREEMNKRFHGNAEAIAHGIQPWIDALEESLQR